MANKTKYGNSAFRSGKTPNATANRLCYETRNYLSMLDQKPSNFNKTEAAFNKYRERVHKILRGDHKLSNQPYVRRDIAAAFIEDDLPVLVLLNLHRFNFEVSKEWITIISHLLIEIEQNLSVNLHVFVPYLINNYSNSSLAMICGQFFRDLINSSSHHERCLNLDILKALAEYAMTDHFEISSDAFESFKALIVSDKEFVAGFLAENYLEVKSLIYKMLESGYFFKRQTLNMLYNMLKMPSCQSFTKLFARDTDNLKYIMNQLRDESKHIQCEAFYLFYVIVGNVLLRSSDKRPVPVLKILQKNKGRLVAFFENFQLERDDDEFQNDRFKLLSSLNEV